MNSSRTWSSRSTRGHRRARRSVVVVLATIAAAAGWFAAAHLLDIDVLSPQMGDQSPAAIGLTQVIVAGVGASIAGWLLLAGLERVIPRRAPRIWLGVSLAALVVSLGAPLTGAGITPANRVVLAILHTVVAAVLIPGLLRTAEPVYGVRARRHE